MRHFIVSAIAGAALGVLMLIGGGLPAPSPQACPGCAVLVHANPACPTAVQGGWVCG